MSDKLLRKVSLDGGGGKGFLSSTQAAAECSRVWKNQAGWEGPFPLVDWRLCPTMTNLWGKERGLMLKP